ncbi:MAG: hypothetical protein A3K19_30215 [Lentisphaerae bacterium RIFOXYB12_FULL_65_16]|nr:MAG: hypothetical protein A3K18_29580 [Lentisphaerae bacterium RIFOXYA12_64_32]OGV85849.1 MAG: hypothetical protein A3K19_30215 [Lentisphaerae bacterium RIFOXYB12_FULL_65_16]
MHPAGLCSVLVAGLVWCQGVLAQPAGVMRQLENENLAVTLDEQTGMFSILDKRAKVRWVQFSESAKLRAAKPTDILKLRRAAAPVTVDGSLAEWANVPVLAVTPDMVTEGKVDGGAADLTASVQFLWDEKNLYLAAKVTDDTLTCRDTAKADEELLKWWERDSIEFWVGATQGGLVLNPQKSLVAINGKEVAGAQVVMKTEAGGYMVEAAIPLAAVPELGTPPAEGRRVAVAIGINDADATGSREGQIYYPKSWVHSKPETFADAVLADAAGNVSAEALRQAEEASRVAIRNVSAVSKPHPGLRFETDLDVRKGPRMPATVTLLLPKGAAELQVEIAGVNETELGGGPWSGGVKYPLPLMPESGAETWLALAPYADGLLLPMVTGDMPRMSWGSDMAFFGVANLQNGWGYACIFDTPYDTRIELVATSSAKPSPLAAGPVWSPSMGKWSYTRKALYRFSATGGYVATAKAYRAYAKEHGFLTTLRQKMKRRPDIAKILGAPDVWGADGVHFARQAKAAGIDRMLINCGGGVKAVEEIKALGYLVSVYDNYEDTMIGKSGAYGDFKLEDAPLLADGKRMLGWPVHRTDPKTGKTELDPATGKPLIVEQFQKRCTALFEPVAQKWIPVAQEKDPRNARFLDVTTACGIVECYDPNHGGDRAKDVANRQALARYVADDLGLVLGGEHGRWWGVPHYDYWEGMKSGGFYSWPAGHVGMDLPKTREEIGTDYLKYGIGHYYRVPYWELVFNDCVVSYWYWGDSTGHLWPAAPEISYKQDLFDMLYSDPPLYWVAQPYSFRWSDPVLRERLLESYRNTCKLHEQTGLEELLTHEWLTDDRTVQKTTFSGGTLVVVNFDEQKTYDLKDGDTTYTLAPLGFFAKGPTVLQYRIRTGDRTVTYIKTPDFFFCDPAGVAHDFGPVVTPAPITVRTIEKQKLQITRNREGGPVSIRPAQLVDKWDAKSSHLFLLDDNGARLRELSADVKEKGAIDLPQTGVFELVCGGKFDLPNPSVTAADVSVTPDNPRQGDKLTVAASIANSGHEKAKKTPVSLYLGTQTPENLVRTETVTVKPGHTEKVTWVIDTANLDGARKLIVVVDPENRLAELIEQDNVAEKQIVIAPDWARWRFQVRAEVVNGPIEQEDVPVALALDLGSLLKRQGGSGALDPNSIRVCERKADGTPGATLPCQFDKAANFDAKKNATGEVAWLIPGKLAAGVTRPYTLLFDVTANGQKTATPGQVWDATNQAVTTETYTATIKDGCVTDVSAKAGTGPGKRFLASLVYSSKQTGWTTEEEAQVLGVDVLSNGPVRAAVKVRKKLRGDLTYEKTYTFYPNRFDLLFTADKTYGNISRAYYAAEGTFEDSAGNKAKVDGKGDAESVSGKCPDPKYYVVYAPDWAHSCVALGKFSGTTYWDAGSAWGGIGLNGGDLAGARMSYVIHAGGQPGGAFGKVDSDRLANPPTVRLIE